MEGSGSGPILRYYDSICLEELRKNTKALSQDSQFPGRELNPRPPEYETGELTTQPRRSVCKCQRFGETLSPSSALKSPHGVTAQNKNINTVSTLLCIL
jgi:hypothetical protein